MKIQWTLDGFDKPFVLHETKKESIDMLGDELAIFHIWRTRDNPVKEKGFLKKLLIDHLASLDAKNGPWYYTYKILSKEDYEKIDPETIDLPPE